ncbi:MAG: hypothetical protein ABIC91_07435 [Nanoarchaeota archaeon]|nr:hypothetical protein [Nanoarchaeota archaeon]
MKPVVKKIDRNPYDSGPKVLATRIMIIIPKRFETILEKLTNPIFFIVLDFNRLIIVLLINNFVIIKSYCSLRLCKTAFIKQGISIMFLVALLMVVLLFILLMMFFFLDKYIMSIKQY